MAFILEVVSKRPLKSGGVEEEILDDGGAVGGDDAFGVKLEPEDGVGAVAERHDVSLFVAGGHKQT